MELPSKQLEKPFQSSEGTLAEQIHFRFIYISIIFKTPGVGEVTYRERERRNTQN